MNIAKLRRRFGQMEARFKLLSVFMILLIFAFNVIAADSANCETRTPKVKNENPAAAAVLKPAGKKPGKIR
jgi:hypothetical protein